MRNTIDQLDVIQREEENSCFEHWLCPVVDGGHHAHALNHQKGHQDAGALEIVWPQIYLRGEGS